MKLYKRPYFTVGVLMLVTEIIKQIILTVENGGVYQIAYLPFQLCDIPMYICLLIGLIKSDKICRTLLTFIQDFALLAGFITFADTSGLFYDNPLLTAHAFLWHFALIGIGFLAGVGPITKRTLKDFGAAVSIYLGSAVIAEILNLSLDHLGVINMFYINPHYHMVQIVFSSIADVIGNIPCIIFYLFMTIVGAGALHLILYIANKEHLKRR